MSEIPSTLPTGSYLQPWVEIRLRIPEKEKEPACYRVRGAKGRWRWIDNSQPFIEVETREKHGIAIVDHTNEIEKEHIMEEHDLNRNLGNI